MASRTIRQLQKTKSDKRKQAREIFARQLKAVRQRDKRTKSLSRNGKLFVIFGHKGIQGNLTEAGLRNSFGKNYRVDYIRLALKKSRRTYNNALVVTRLK